MMKEAEVSIQKFERLAIFFMKITGCYLRNLMIRKSSMKSSWSLLSDQKKITLIISICLLIALTSFMVCFWSGKTSSKDFGLHVNLYSFYHMGKVKLN